MLKAMVQKADGGHLVILGLSRRNCELLLEGKPIRVKASDVGIPESTDEIWLMGGESEEAIKAELAKSVQLPEEA